MIWDLSIGGLGHSNVYIGVRLVRGSTAIQQGAASHSLTARATAELSSGGSAKLGQLSGSYLDSPSSTSELTYKIQTYHHSHAVIMNQGSTSNHNYDISSTSKITLLEVST